MHATATALFDSPARPAVTIDLNEFHKETLKAIAFATLRRLLKLRGIFQGSPSVVLEDQLQDLGVITEALEQVLGSYAMEQVFRAVEAQQERRPWEQS